MMARTVWAFGVVGCLQLVPAAAQTPMPPERPRELAPGSGEGSDTQSKPDAPPYQVKLERLAELMGTLTFLRDICPPGDGAVWRGKMEELLAAEGSTPMRRDRLAGAFNRGFDGYRVTYRTCTPAAELVIQRSLAEGSNLARDISARFSG